MNYRVLYGKLFSALLKQFGANCIHEVEDAIQNTFYKSLKRWKANENIKDIEAWLYVVAKNDVLNQLKKQQRFLHTEFFESEEGTAATDEDLRLKTILFLVKATTIARKAKVVFILKNIFGLHIKEISTSTLISEAALYKSIRRAKGDFKTLSNTYVFDEVFKQAEAEDIVLVEEVLYAVFNIGFDSFNEKKASIVNEDLCLEALALLKMLWENFKKNTTTNLLALCCFHIARIPEKIKEGKFVPFFKQNKAQWNQDFIRLGYYYLEKPNNLNSYYIKALITSKHMTAQSYDTKHWDGIIKLYTILQRLSSSPIVKLNLCYCLYKNNQNTEAIKLLNSIEEELPEEHVYFSLIKAHILGKTKVSETLINKTLKTIKQHIRTEYILEHMV